MLSPLSLPCLPNDKVVFTMISSASVCKIALIYVFSSQFIAAKAVISPTYSWTIFLYIWKFFVLLSGLFPGCSNGPEFDRKQYDQEHFIHIFKSKHFLLQDSGKKVNRQLAALGFTPSHEVLQKLSRGVEHCRPISDKD